MFLPTWGVGQSLLPQELAVKGPYRLFPALLRPLPSLVPHCIHTPPQPVSRVTFCSRCKSNLSLPSNRLLTSGMKPDPSPGLRAPRLQAPSHCPASPRRVCLTQAPCRSLDSTSPLPASATVSLLTLWLSGSRPAPPGGRRCWPRLKDTGPLYRPSTRNRQTVLRACVLLLSLSTPRAAGSWKQGSCLLAGLAGHPSLTQQTHKAGRVVVPHGLGVPEGLQQRVGADDLVFQRPLEQGVRAGRAPCEGELQCPSAPADAGPSPIPCFLT